MREPVVVSLDALLARIVREQFDDALRAALVPIIARLEALAAAAPPALVSVEEAAKRLELSAPTVRRQLASGELPGVRLAGRWRVDLAALGRRTRPETDEMQAREARAGR